MPNPPVMILVDEAVDRLNNAGAPYGVRVAPWATRRLLRAKQRNTSASDINQLERSIAPLELPTEFRTFITRWDPSSLQWPVFDGLIPVKHLAERRSMERPASAEVLLPIADWGHSRIWLELASGSHPGGRIFQSYYDENQLGLWAFGFSNLLDLVSTAFERDLIDDRTGSLHERHFHAVVKRSLDSLIGVDGPRVFPEFDRQSYPAHWLAAEGLGPEHFALRGATHSVEDFRDQRSTHTSLVATLVGTYESGVGGGPLRGSIGTFSDATGSIQVFVPQLTGLSGGTGAGGAVEIDVFAVQPNGEGLQSLSAKAELQRAVRAGQYDYSNDLIVRLFEQMKDLDTSVVVTGMRPVH